MARSRNASSGTFKYVAFAAFAIAVVALCLSAASLYLTLNNKAVAPTSTVTTTVNSSFGQTLAGIDTPLNASELAVINNAPDAYFETAGLMLLNGTLKNQVSDGFQSVNAFVINNKTSVFYLGATTCLWCGDNRWAMALALSRFGTFSKLYTGYSSFGDLDLPTLYWHVANYTEPDIYTVTPNGLTIGANYSSQYINFLPIEWQGNITGDIFYQSLPVTSQEVNMTGNSTYITAFGYFVGLQNNSNTVFKGTPYTVWGNDLFPGTDAVIFGNSTPLGNIYPLEYMTHAQVLSQLQSGTDQFALSYYAAADVYVASVCGSINNTAPVCSLSAIRQIEALK